MQSEPHRQEDEDKEKQVSPAVGQQGPSQHSSSYTSGVNLKFSLIVETEINPSTIRPQLVSISKEMRASSGQ